MKKIFLAFMLIFTFVSTTFADELSDKIQNAVQIIETNIDQKWDVYSQKVLTTLEKYATKYKDVAEKVSIINDIEYRLIKDQKLKPIQYAIADGYTPVFYSHDLKNIFGGADGKTLKLDDSNQIDEVEVIALTGAVFEIYAEIQDGSNTIFKIYTRDYDYLTKTGYYIDSRFVKQTDTKPEIKTKTLPAAQTILDRVKAVKWAQYVRWGNAPQGVAKLLEFYAPKWEIDANLKSKWILSWVDCSGLLYYATDGYTPRNTSTLATYWSGVEIQWLNIDEILAKLQPLDIIVWRWHMIIVLDKETSLDASLENWVTTSNSKDTLKEVMETRTPINNYDDPAFTDKLKFVVRRWYPN